MGRISVDLLYDPDSSFSPWTMFFLKNDAISFHSSILFCSSSIDTGASSASGADTAESGVDAAGTTSVGEENAPRAV